MSVFRIGLVGAAFPVVVLSLVIAVGVNAVAYDNRMSFRIFLDLLGIFTAILLLIAIVVAIVSAIAGKKEVAKGIGIGIGIGIVSLGISASILLTQPTPTPTSTSTTITPVDQVTFPDANLEVAVRKAINTPKDPIYTSDLEALIRLEAQERSILDLTGLEYCVNLQTIFLSDNNISDISPLASLTNLEWLYLHNNNISDISALAGLTNLESLGLDGSNISDISALAGLINLWSLSLDSSNISDISALAGLTNLKYLRLGNNSISDISFLVQNSGLSDGDTVDLSGNPLSTTSVNVYISQLKARGVTVLY